VSKRATERGAALIMMLLIATLILAAGGALILSTATTGTNTIDAAAEKQAYYAAEAGLQMAMNVLRGNITRLGTVPAGTTMSLRTAVTPALSNGGAPANNNPCVSDTTAAPSPCRLAGWLDYNGAATIPVDNVAGTAFSTVVFDPDASNRVRFTVTGQWSAPNLTIPGVVITVSPNGRTLTIVAAGKITTITYNPPAQTTINNASQAVASNLGSFTVSNGLTGAAALAAGLVLANFNYTVTQDLPWASSANFKAKLQTPVASVCADASYELRLDKPTLKADGTIYAVTGLNNLGGIPRLLGLPCPPGTQTMGVNVTAPEPRQIIVRSTGFGPHWSRKQLEMTVRRADLAFEAPATLTIRGADDCSPLNFATGSSGAKNYSGKDHPPPGAEPDKPAFAVMECSLPSTTGGLEKPETVDDPKIGVLDNPNIAAPYIPVEMPWFLQTADNARQYLNELEIAARAQGRYIKQAGTLSYNQGTAANPLLTFVDGNCELEGGAGFLVVTGTLSMSGNPNFDGVVVVMGGGSVTRGGGGDGAFNGAMVVARFARTWPISENGMAHPFLTPTFNTNGGGNSDFQYNSTSVSRALNALGSRVGGVLEY
jgi:type II secretory pathway pseudopilin PulG